jgi:hypothetical protein
MTDAIDGFKKYLIALLEISYLASATNFTSNSIASSIR